MIRWYYLFSRKFKILLSLLVVLGGVSVGVYFLVTEVNRVAPNLDSFRTTNEDLNIESILKSEKLREYTANAERISAEEKSYYMCSSIQGLNSWQEFQCSLVYTSNNERENARITTFTFSNVSEYILDCTLDTSSTACNIQPQLDNSELLRNRVYTSATRFINQYTEGLSYGPEITLLERIDVVRKIALEDSTQGILGNYSVNDKVISLGIVPSGTETSVELEMYSQALLSNVGTDSTYSRTKRNILNTFLYEYGHHISTYNKPYENLNENTLKANNPRSPLNTYFNSLLSSLDKVKAASVLEQNEFDSFNKTKEIIELANTPVLSTADSDKIIDLFYEINAPTDANNVVKQATLNELLSAKTKSKISNYSCTNTDYFAFRGKSNIGDKASLSAGDRNSLVEEILYWFSYEEIMSRLYAIITYDRGGLQTLSGCPRFDNNENEILADHLTFKLFGIDVFKSNTETSVVANLIYNNIWEWAAQDQTVTEDKGVVLSKVNSNSETLVASNLHIAKDGSYTVIGITNPSASWDTRLENISVYWTSLNYGPNILLQNINNLFYKNDFIPDETGVTSLIASENSNSNFFGFVANFRILPVETTLDSIPKINQGILLFDDVRTPNRYYGTIENSYTLLQLTGIQSTPTPTPTPSGSTP